MGGRSCASCSLSLSKAWTGAQPTHLHSEGDANQMREAGLFPAPPPTLPPRAGDSLPSHKDHFFSTTDQDSDLRSSACGALDVCCPTWMVSNWGGPHKSSENGINWKSDR